MGRAYSNYLRERVLTRVLLGETVRSVAALYSISPSAVVKWSQRYRRTGSVAPGRIGGYKRKLLADHRDFVRACFAAQPDLTLRDLQARLLAERGVKVSYGAVWDFVHSEGLSYKKPRSPANRTVQRSRGGGCNGASIRVGLRRPGWFLSMKPG